MGSFEDTGWLGSLMEAARHLLDNEGRPGPEVKSKRTEADSSEPAADFMADKGHDVCGPHDTIERPHHRGQQTATDRSVITSRLGTRDNVVEIAGSGPKHPEYVTEESRRLSFRDWPMAMPQRPDQLAKAGFFYCGKGPPIISIARPLATLLVCVLSTWCY